MKLAFLDSNEAAALAAGSIGIRHEDPARGFGAALAGERVVCIADGYGLRAALEELAVQACLRVPMVLNVGCERADLLPALHNGWIVLRARDAQTVYDLNLAAVKIGEHPEVRLPVLIAYNGITSREKRRVEVADEEAVKSFLGKRPALPTALDIEHPATLRAGVNKDIELTRAMQAARDVIVEVFADLIKLTGRNVEEAGVEILQASDALEPAVTGAPAQAARAGLAPIRAADPSRGMAKLRRDEKTGRLEVELEPLWKMTSAPNRLAPGHGACPGCGALTTLHQIHKVLEGDVVMLLQGGCASVVTTAGESTAHLINVMHDFGANSAAILSGLAEASASKDITFVMITGDGGMGAGLAAAVAAASRNPRMMILEYDNQGRMSTGGQPSLSTALGRRISTDEIFAACHLPYVFTAAEGYPEDLMRKVAKAQWYAKNEGMVYGRFLSFCPLHWQTADDAAQPVLQAAIDSCFFPLYEVERGHTAITYDPDATGRRRPVTDWLKLMGKSAHLADPANAATVARLQAETDRRWARLKAMHEHPLL